MPNCLTGEPSNSSADNRCSVRRLARILEPRGSTVPRQYKREVIAIVPCLLLGVAALVFGEPLLSKVGVTESLRTPIVTVGSILLMLTGFLLAAHTLHASSLATFEAKLAQVKGTLRAFDGDTAFAYIARRALSANTILNTMVMHAADTHPLLTDLLDEWRVSRREAINKGVHVREVVSGGYRDRALALAVEFPLGHKRGKYEAYVVDCQLGALINFTVLEYSEGPSEVVFGWVISTRGGFERPCFQSFDPKVVTLFATWFTELALKGDLITS